MPSAPKLSDRAAKMPASPIRRLAPFAVDARRRGVKVYGLNIGQPDIPAPDAVLARLRAFNETNVAYGPSQGLPEFVESVRTYYAQWDLDFAHEEICATTGGSEALLFSFAAIADPGDDLLVFEPFYTNYTGFAELIGVRTTPVTTRAEDGYHLPPRAEIEARITNKTRAIVLCSPNNPTGTVYTDDELELIGELCHERGLFLIADEVYREFTYDGLTHRSAMTLGRIRDRIILTDSLSKRISLCGARVGWIATHNREVLSAVLKFGQARLCPPTLGQFVGVAMNDAPASYMRDVIAEYQRRRDLVFGRLQQMPDVQVRRPEGAFYLCAGLPVDDAQSFAEFLLRDFALDGETVMVAPGDGFYATPGRGRNEIRIAYVLERSALATSMEIIRSALECYAARASK